MTFSHVSLFVLKSSFHFLSISFIFALHIIIIIIPQMRKRIGHGSRPNLAAIKAKISDDFAAAQASFLSCSEEHFLWLDEVVAAVQKEAECMLAKNE